MSYGIWGRVKPQETRVVGEKAFRRAPLPAWDARWHSLSVPARTAFLDEIKSPVKRASAYGKANQPSVAVEMFAPEVLRELTTAGFVEVREAKGKSPSGRVFAVDAVTDFLARIRGLRRYHLLDPDQPGKVETYVNACFYSGELNQAVLRVLVDAGIEDYWSLEDILRLYVLKHQWPDWVVGKLNDPIAGRIVTVVRQAKHPLLLADLPGRIEGETPEMVRSSLDALIAHLALVEDLDPETLDLQVGLLPAVRESMDRADQPRARPPLPVCETPKELGPDESIVVGDLRAFLLEVASEPPRLRQDGTLFQKEIERFTDVFDPLPSWLADFLKLTPGRRLEQARRWASSLKLVTQDVEGKQIHLQLGSRGQKWLTAGVDQQPADLIATFRSSKTDNGLDLDDSPEDEDEGFFGYGYGYGFDPYSYYVPGDQVFLGANVAAFKPAKGKSIRALYQARPKDFEDLRAALDRTFSALPVGTFYRLDDFVAHFAFGTHNPVSLGLDPEQGKVAVFRDGRPVPPLAEQREEVGRSLLEAFARLRLIPMGCLRTAIDDQGRLCIAREPQLDVYFGRKLAPETRATASSSAAAAMAASRVIVQPDFSIVVIGPNPAPAAELIPFCERATRGSGRGAIVLKITRDAVIRAVAHGLKPSEVVARLKRHASQEVPDNVLREVEGWSSWVRHITPETLTVLRCPDREAADRVMAALRKRAERIQDTMVAIDAAKLTAVERKKLQEQGIILGRPARPEAPKAKRKVSRRRY